ncbi:hypothetical protein SAMN05216366_104121 [Selenomonas ruminantium]|uniref:Uncharacterized protein n=1 Tax=Selenomonas ruminantium TaxID=971 RepID=A0A1H0P5M0_SELRU|nr:hypothetical protein SAMN05216366_104121 [Selenomonas ruminantium]
MYKLCKHLLYAIVLILCIISEDIWNKLNCIAIFLYLKVSLTDGDDWN